MQGRGPRENIKKKIYICEFLKGFYLCFCFSAFIEKRVHFFIFGL